MDLKRDRKEKSQVLSLPRYRHMPNLSVQYIMCLMVLTKFCAAPVTYIWQCVKAFDMADIKDDGMTKIATIVLYLAEYYITCWKEVE